MTTWPSVAAGTGLSVTTSRSSSVPCFFSTSAFMVLAATPISSPSGLLSRSGLSSLDVTCQQPPAGPEALEMKENFRQFLDRLRQAGELIDLHQAVDIRHIATLVDQARTALYFHNVI